METETLTTAQVLGWTNPARFDAWCGVCQAVTESDDTTSRWCLECGSRRADHN